MRYLDLPLILYCLLVLALMISIVGYLIGRGRGFVLGSLLSLSCLVTNSYNAYKRVKELAAQEQPGDIIRRCAEGETTYLIKTLNGIPYEEPGYKCTRWTLVRYLGDHRYEEIK